MPLRNRRHGVSLTYCCKNGLIISEQKSFIRKFTYSYVAFCLRTTVTYPCLIFLYGVSASKCYDKFGQPLHAFTYTKISTFERQAVFELFVLILCFQISHSEMRWIPKNVNWKLRNSFRNSIALLWEMIKNSPKMQKVES